MVLTEVAWSAIPCKVRVTLMQHLSCITVSLYSFSSLGKTMNSELHFDVGLETAIVAIPLSSFYIKAKSRVPKRHDSELVQQR
jgi:hypothetical protein